VNLDLEHHGTRLLEWLYRQPGHDHQFSDVTEFISMEGLPEDCGRPLVDYLREQGLVRTAIGLDGRPDSMITPKGIAHLHRTRAQHQDPAVRAHTLRSQMLQWLYRHEQVNDMAPPDWSSFLASDEASGLGEPFTLKEMEQAASYLSNKSLITGVDIAEAEPGWVRPMLTDNGRDCVLDYGGRVADYFGRLNGGTVNTTYIGSNSGNVAVGSEYVKQNVTTGLDTSKLLELAAAVSQALPVLGLTPDQHSRLEGYAMELHDAAGAAQPDRGKLRGLVDAVMAGLTRAATPVATAIATGLGNDAVRAISGH
jgi:hypothetical protein